MTEIKSKKLWFRAKTYGYGWTPCTWQGWVVTLFYIASSMTIFIQIDRSNHSGSYTLNRFALPFIALTFFMIVICVFKGEKAGWRWGKSVNSK